MILTLTSRKGGCGKTVLAMVIAAALAEQGGDVALLDADPNGSAYRWATDILHAPTIRAYAEADAERLADLLPTLAERHAGVVVDTAGFGNQAATVAAAAADLVLVPVSPGEADVMEAQRTVAYVAGLARSTRREIPVRVVVNRVRRNTDSGPACGSGDPAPRAAPTGHHDQRGRRVWGNELFRSAPDDRHCGRGSGRADG